MAVTTAWKRYCKLTIDYTKVNADATDYPVYLNDVSLPSEVFGTTDKAATASGGDIRFTSDAAGQNELCREIAYFDKAGASGSKCAIYVKISSLSSSVNTVFYMWYANPSATDYGVTTTYGRNNVWSNNFRLVAHLYSTTIPESSGYVSGNATVNGTVTFADAAYGCRKTNTNLTTTNYLSWAYDADVCRNGTLFGAVGTGNGATFETLCNPTDWDTDTGGGTGSRRQIITVGEGTGSTGQSWAFWRAYSSGNRFSSLEIRTGSGWTFEELNPAVVAATDQWYYMAGIHTNESTDAYRSVVYGSGGVVQNATQAPAASPYDVTDNTSALIKIGCHVSFGSFNGQISEIRVSTKPRAQSWIITTQENYFRPLTFTTNGGGQSNGGFSNQLFFFYLDAYDR